MPVTQNFFIHKCLMILNDVEYNIQNVCQANEHSL